MTALRRLLAVIAGLVLSLSFAPVDSWGASIVGVALLTLVLRAAPTSRSAYLDAVLCGLAFFVPLLSWVRAPGLDAWLALAAYQGVLFAIIGPLIRRSMTAKIWWPLLAAGCWVAEEALRDRLLFGGFPWGRLAFAQADAPTLRWISWGGAPVLSFITALAGTLLAAALVAVGRWLTPPPGDRSAAARALASAAGLLLGTGALLGSAHVIPLLSADGPGVRVAVVQGNVPRLGLAAFAQRAAVLRNHVIATIDAMHYVQTASLPRPELIIWPENSSDIDPINHPQAGAFITQAARAAGVPILVGAVLDGKIDSFGDLLTVRNSGLVWNPDGSIGATYVKRHPVPFGEYIPFRSVLGHLIGRLSLIPYDFERGKAVGRIPIAHTVLGDVICFEVAYDAIVRDAVKAGGQFLVVQTNNATFGHSSESAQQLAMGRVRAVEHNRAVVVAATSGISAVISPRGTVLAHTSIFERDVLYATLPQLTSTTLADRVGEIPEWILTGGVLITLVLLSWRQRGRKHA